MSPAEIRDILGLYDQCMIAFAGGEISIAPGASMAFWELARFAKHGLSAVKSTENISRMIDVQSTAVSSNLTVEQAFQLKRNAFNAKVMFSNLGCLPFGSTFGPLKLEALWAPSALRGIEGDHRSGHRQWLAAPHTHQPRADSRPARGYQTRTPQSLRGLTQFPKLGIGRQLQAATIHNKGTGRLCLFDCRIAMLFLLWPKRP
jgi:hypothetical protein